MIDTSTFLTLCRVQINTITVMIVFTLLNAHGTYTPTFQLLCVCVFIDFLKVPKGVLTDGQSWGCFVLRLDPEPWQSLQSGIGLRNGSVGTGLFQSDFDNWRRKQKTSNTDIAIKLSFRKNCY